MLARVRLKHTSVDKGHGLSTFREEGGRKFDKWLRPGDIIQTA